MTMREWWSKLHRVVWRRALDEELAEEMRAHADLMADDNLARGLSPQEARTAAQRSFGNMTAVQERAREAWRFPKLESLLHDLRCGLRAIRQSPGFSLVVILTLALGIGANTAIFSVVYSVLLRSLPYPSGNRLVMLGENAGKGIGISVTWINYQHWRAENHAFEDMAAFVSGTDLTMTGRGETVLTHGALVTSNYFHLVGARPIQGRLLTADDDRVGAPSTVLLTYDFWVKRLGADPRAVGSSLALNGKANTIVGILRPDSSPLLLGRDYYLPLRPTGRQTLNRDAHGSMRALALLKSGVTLAQARSNLDEIMQRLALSDGGPESDHRAFAQFLTERITAIYGPLCWCSWVRWVLFCCSPAPMSPASCWCVAPRARARWPFGPPSAPGVCAWRGNCSPKTWSRPQLAAFAELCWLPGACVRSCWPAPRGFRASRKSAWTFPCSCSPQPPLS
jgi:putative ABC transport system permease protein